MCDPLIFCVRTLLCAYLLVLRTVRFFSMCLRIVYKKNLKTFIFPLRTFIWVFWMGIFFACVIGGTSRTLCVVPRIFTIAVCHTEYFFLQFLCAYHLWILFLHGSEASLPNKSHFLCVLCHFCNNHAVKAESWYELEWGWWWYWSDPSVWGSVHVPLVIWIWRVVAGGVVWAPREKRTLVGQGLFPRLLYPEYHVLHPW